MSQDYTTIRTEDQGLDGGNHHCLRVPAWSFIKRISFRFVFAYLLLYNLPFPINVLPGGYFLGLPWTWLWNAVVPWAGKVVFGVDITVFPNGSGDTTYNYVQIFCFFVLALFAALLWSLLDRKRGDYRVLHRWLHAHVRFVLALTMFSYGLAKVFMTQFGPPSPDKLLSTYGESSPMGLLWTFMGASTAYCVFTGLAECVSGILLTMRRTTLIGALLCMAVMTHVVMLNFCYDVPVKLYSSHLLAMAGFLVIPDIRRVLNVLLLNKATPPALMQPLFSFLPLHKSVLIVRSVGVVILAAAITFQNWQAAEQYGPSAPKSSLHGIWNVQKFEVDGKPVPPLLNDKSRWRRLVFSHPEAVTVHLINDQRSHYTAKIEEKDARFTLTKGPKDKSKWQAVFTMTRPQPDLLTLDGSFETRKLHLELKRQPESKSLLVSRGFHWINEYPFNQ